MMTRLTRNQGMNGLAGSMFRWIQKLLVYHGTLETLIPLRHGSSNRLDPIFNNASSLLWNPDSLDDCSLLKNSTMRA